MGCITLRSEGGKNIDQNKAAFREGRREKKLNGGVNLFREFQHGLLVSFVGRAIDGTKLKGRGKTIEIRRQYLVYSADSKRGLGGESQQRKKRGMSKSDSFSMPQSGDAMRQKSRTGKPKKWGYQR